MGIAYKSTIHCGKQTSWKEIGLKESLLADELESRVWIVSESTRMEEDIILSNLQIWMCVFFSKKFCEG